MSATTRATCKRCRRHKDEVGAITWEGYCSPCGKIVYTENLDQLHEKSGPYYLHWARRSLMASRNILRTAEHETT